MAEPVDTEARKAQQELAEIERKRAELARQAKQVRAREAQRQRELKLERERLAGRCVLAAAERDEAFRTQLLRLLDGRLAAARERALFGLSTRSGG